MDVATLAPAHATKKRVLSIASCFFYAAWDIRYIGLLLFISIVDWFVANRANGGVLDSITDQVLIGSAIESCWDID